MAPELQSVVQVSTETLTSLAVPKERTRFYSRLRTLRLTHGVVDFLLGYLSLAKLDHCSLFFENVHQAETLDQEFLATLLRRANPHHLSLTIGTSPDPLPDPLQTALNTYARSLRPDPMTIEERESKLQAWNIPQEWKHWLVHSTEGWQGEWEPLQHFDEQLFTAPPEESTFEAGVHTLLKQASPITRHALAQTYIEAECTLDTLPEKISYELLEPLLRQQWHDDRATTLEKLKAWSLHLGAIPYHRERGQDSSGMGAEALQAALDYCINIGYYDSTVDFGHRGRRIIDWPTQPEKYWTFTTKMTTSLAALSRPEEAEALYREARALSSSPLLHMQAAYAQSMLYTRHHKPEQRDHQIAKGWINEAIAIAQLLPDLKERVFNTVFNQNGLALIEVHMGHSQEALRLVTEGLERLNSTLEPDEHLLHRSVLLYNRAQVYAGLGQIEQALADYTTVILQDPHYSEYYLDRGNLYRRLSHIEEALSDYEQAIAFSPPYPEAYYNRAGTLLLLGREDEALADYTYVLELDPTYLDALINRASIFYEHEDFAASRQDIEHGLALDPGNPQLLCTLGLLEMAQEHPDEAHQALTSALERDPSLLAAWTNRAVLAYECGNIDAAIADLTQALELDENATVLYNRGQAYQSQGRWPEAIHDYTRALTQADDDDTQDLLYKRGCCYWQLGDSSSAYQDFVQHMAMGPSPYQEELHQLGIALPANP